MGASTSSAHTGSISDNSYLLEWGCLTCSNVRRTETFLNVNRLEKDWQKAWKVSQPTVDDSMNAGEAKQRIQGAVDEMKKIKKKAEESVADVDPTLFTGNVDEASCARIEKLLVMSITYRPRAVETKKTKWNGRGRKGNQGEKQKPEAKAKETKAEKQKSEARTKAVNAKKQILTKEKKKYNARKSNRKKEQGKDT
ncbi:hypothetical protein FOXYS1_6689 [Fusarium oxysporum]|uniref:Uncharacterized protein n=1 Tax=Fusarium oxysporum TaxID=5507 RepID=A0A8H5AC22_FUSOX|nr:hypothetical protein FOXYS1_6689 [Fusarium oxysporum]